MDKQDELVLRRWCVEQAGFILKTGSTPTDEMVLALSQKLYDWVVQAK